ncbi:hypothetical protein BFJ63_vAg16332 [Fusarium oxysporum f. sp. narcissi]|uniref:BZIP domain-containing protein n=3 Tax=Fusarium oxysporum TaxID=5507 RepID=F9GDZ8_FUSOF|nr:hypothetical protein FOXB_16882 [Fusarium oxysporum f. sp. conglutinans Fo5176]KAG6980269.1 Transcription factor atf21 [Fusarium oxysporum f. sp. conglutinans]RYC80779.1 hypothetical protein BFJ63_vAg16332 [Fusarium oxysporum f. sp. narcissi]
MKDNSPFGDECVFQPLPGKHWWPSDHTIPPGISGDWRSTANGVHTATAPLLDGFVYGYDADSIDRWNCIRPMINSTYWWNGLDSTTNYVAQQSSSKHMVTKELPSTQGYWYLPATAKDASLNQNYGFNDLSTRKASSRSHLAYENLDSEPKIKKQSTSCRTTNTSSNSVYPAQKDNDRIQRDQERNRISAYKLRVKKREYVSRLESRTQELERVHRELSTCVANLSLEVYELKMQILQQSGCNCDLMRNYIAHESQRCMQALVEEPQSAVSFLQVEAPMRCEQK